MEMRDEYQFDLKEREREREREGEREGERDGRDCERTMSYRDEQEDLSGTLIPRRKTASSLDRIVDPRASSGKSDR